MNGQIEYIPPTIDRTRDLTKTDHAQRVNCGTEALILRA